MADKIRIGVVGAGNNTRERHLPGLQAIPGVEILTVCNRSRESGRRVAEAFGIAEVAESWEQVVHHPKVDAVMIGTWPYMHAPVTVAALEAGKHVLCEARMAMNLKEAEAMLAASRARPELTAQIVPSPFTLKWDRFLKRQLEEGLIGEVLAVDVYATNGNFVDFDREMTWRDDVRLSGLNTLTLGIHYEAMARWVGHAESVRAHGRIQVKRRRDADGQLHDLHIPDHLDVFGDLTSGASYHIRCSHLTGACPTPNDFILYGSSGTLRLNLTDSRLTLNRPGQSEKILQVPENEAESWRVEEEFIGAIRGEEPVRLTTFTEALQYMDFTQRVADELKFAPSEIRKP